MAMMAMVMLIEKRRLIDEASEKNDEHDVNDENNNDDDEHGWQGELPVGRGDVGVPLPAGLHLLQGMVQLMSRRVFKNKIDQPCKFETTNLKHSEVRFR